MHHYKAVAEAIAIPIMVYNNPATANVDLKPELVARLAEIPGCDYIKESTLEVTRVRDIIRLCGDRMTVFGGVLGFESFVEGAQGWVAVASNVAPGPMAKLFTMVADEGRVFEARAHYLHWLPVIEAVFGQYYVGGTKALLNHMGFSARRAAAAAPAAAGRGRCPHEGAGRALRPAISRSERQSQRHDQAAPGGKPFHRLRRPDPAGRARRDGGGGAGRAWLAGAGPGQGRRAARALLRHGRLP